MPRFRPAVALAVALLASCPSLPRAEITIRLDPAPQEHADAIRNLVARFEDWLDAHAPWPRRDMAPRIRLVGALEANARRGRAGDLHDGRLRGLYDPGQAEILLVRPWNPRNLEDASVLLHELIHHRQVPHHWYCPAAQELPAYRLQEAWLAERGASLEVNWVGVVLKSGCTPRDIHPD